MPLFGGSDGQRARRETCPRPPDGSHRNYCCTTRQWLNEVDNRVRNTQSSTYMPASMPGTGRLAFSGSITAAALVARTAGERGSKRARAHPTARTAITDVLRARGLTKQANELAIRSAPHMEQIVVPARRVMATSLARDIRRWTRYGPSVECGRASRRRSTQGAPKPPN